MPTIPTGQMERELRKLYLRFISGLTMDSKNLDQRLRDFEASQLDVMERMGGRTAAMGALAGFPVPKRLDLSPWQGTVYNDMQTTAIQAGIIAGANSRDAARQMFRAGMDKSYRRLERLARTETTNAYWKNSFDSIKDLPALVMVWGSEDGPRTCAWCRERDGLVMDSANLRDHPNGRCTPIPKLRSQVDYRGSISPDGSIYQDPAWGKSKMTVLAPDLDMPEMVTSRLAEPLYQGPAPKRNEYVVEQYADEQRVGYLKYSNDKMDTLSLYDQIDRDEAIRRINSTLQSVVDNGKMAMQVRSQDIDSILSSGFKSGFDTKTGAGGVNARYYESRDLIEHVNFGSRVEETRPLYGFLDSDAVRTGAAKNYGDVKVVFKDEVRGTTSVSWGDSLNSKAIRPAPVNQVDWYAVDPDLGAYRDVLSGSVSTAQTAGYVELQFHKALTAADIQSLVFPVEPGAELVAKLKTLGIDWSVVSP